MREEPGTFPEYRSVNTQMLGLIIQKVTGQKVADAFSERIFKDEKLLSSIVLHPKLKGDFLQLNHAIVLNTSELFPFCDLVESDFSLDDFVFDGGQHSS
jgi:CubicO group peptidase (beta-lactamase class C family)